MSHSKQTKRGYSLYLESWNSSAKKYINVCMICGYQGYSPVIEADSFKNWVVRRELMKTLPRLELDKLGRCEYCAKIQDSE